MSDVEAYLHLARIHLEAAQFCLENQHPGLAVSESYFSMIASANRLLVERGKPAPKTHHGILSSVYTVLVKQDILQKEEHSALHRAQSWRESWHYLGASPSRSEAKTLMDLADRLYTLPAQP